MKKFFKKFLFFLDRHTYFKPILFFFSVLILCGVILGIFERDESQINGIIDGLWAAIVTFSTVGYGDKVPQTPLGRIVAVVLIFAGVSGMSMLSGSIASFLVERKAKFRRGQMSFLKMSGHMVICGWNDQLKEIVLDIIENSDEYNADDIILVSNVEPEKIDTIRDNPEMAEVKFIKGEFYSEATLMRANISKASKVLILSDTYECKAEAESDSKTIMCVLSVRHLAREIYVCAELNDSKYKSNLKQAACDEIILKKDFSRKLLSGSSVSNGMGHIFYELIDSKNSGTGLYPREIPSSFVGKTYREFRMNFNLQQGILLGLLENTGSARSMKIEALREAQKTSDVSKLVQNLQEVKGIESNQPVFMPDDSYLIKRDSKAIILEKR